MRKLLALALAVVFLMPAVAYGGDITMGNELPDTLTNTYRMEGGFSRAVSVKTAAYTPDTSVMIIQVNTSDAVTIGLPALSTVKTGQIYWIGKGTETGTNAVTIDPYGSETINGGATYTSIDATGDWVQVLSLGDEWVIVGKNIN